MADDGAPSSDPLPQDGRGLADALARRYPADDWLAALAKGAVMSRGDVEAHLLSAEPMPSAILEAAAQLDELLRPPEAGDHVFAAETNDEAAAIETDAEAGLHVLPGPKQHPSRSNSPDEMGQREGDYQYDRT